MLVFFLVIRQPIVRSIVIARMPLPVPCAHMSRTVGRRFRDRQEEEEEETLAQLEHGLIVPRRAGLAPAGCTEVEEERQEVTKGPGQTGLWARERFVSIAAGGVEGG